MPVDSSLTPTAEAFGSGSDRRYLPEAALISLRRATSFLLAFSPSCGPAMQLMVLQLFDWLFAFGSSLPVGVRLPLPGLR